MLKSRYLPVLLALILLLSLLPVLGLSEIWGSSEAREAHIASIIRSTHDWISPSRNGLVPSKPLLHHWLVVCTSYGTGVVDEFSSRFPSMLLGIAVVVLLYNFSLRLFSAVPTYSTRGQQWAFAVAFALCITYGFFSMLMQSMVDMTFAAFAFIALQRPLGKIYLQTLRSQLVELRRGDWLFFYGFCGLATLAKGPLGVALPAIMLFAALAFLVGVRKAALLFLRPCSGWVLYLVIVLPWYLLAFRHSPALLERQIVFENIDRFFGGEFVNSEAFWFYLPILFTRAIPLFWLFLALCIWQLRAKTRDLSTEVTLSMLCAIGSALLFFTIASGKRSTYLLPLYPWIAFTAVWMFARWFLLRSPQLQAKVLRHAWLSFISVNGLLLIIGVGVWIFFLTKSVEASNSTYLIAQQWMHAYGTRLWIAPIVGFVLLSLLFWNKADSFSLWVASLLLFVALSASTLSSVYSLRAKYRSYPEMATRIRSQAASRPIVAVRETYDELLDPILYYLQIPVRIDTPSMLLKSCDPSVLYVSRRGNLSILTPGIDIKEELFLEEKAGKPKKVQERSISLFSCAVSKISHG